MSTAATELRGSHNPDAMATTSPRHSNPIPTERSFLDLDDHADQKTPTRDSFGLQAMQSYQPSLVNEENPSDSASLNRSNSLRSHHSTDSQDINMDDGDGQDMSDNESVTSDSNRPSKKKKGQRFYCTEFPPCQLSFTRSEHLARHIRKHTGERPFQCHCLRRFSRLDNLRQHAQTVHVNEEIPGDSLAATGTRFQRQIRTDRMRPPGGRPRSSTLGSQGSHSRGHSRNYSGSSIGSATSEFGTPDDRRRRPPPLAMAQTTPTRGSLSIDTYSANGVGPDAYRSYYNYSPTGYSTPTSIFSTETGSPVVPSGLQSPISIVPRTNSWGGRTHTRRLSVPSSQNPYTPMTGYVGYGAPYMSPLAGSSTSTFSNGSSMVTSPTNTGFSDLQRDQEFISEAKRKRQTWHSSTYSSTGRPATSGLSYYQTPDAPEPVASTQPTASQSVRLPGIDSFDRAQARPAAPPRRPPSAMEIDEQRPALAQNQLRESGEYVATHRDSWGSMNQNMTRLDITNSTPRDFSSREGVGNPQQGSTPQAVNSQPPQYQIPRKAVPPPVETGNHQTTAAPQQEPPVTPRKQKRQAWYNGPLSATTDPQGSTTVYRTSPEGSSSSEGVQTPSAMQEVHPLILQDHERESVEESVPIEVQGREINHKPHELTHQEPPAERVQNSQSINQTQAVPTSPRSRTDTNRLDALVAVATSEDRAMHDQ